MFSVKDLTEEQKAKIVEWVADGDQLNDLQKKMSKEFGVALTYMDTRFAMMDLGLELVKEEEEVPDENEKDTGASGAGGAVGDDSEATEAPGYVDATVDEIVTPGYLASGKVTFSDGMKARWGLDQMGRLSVDADDPNYEIDDTDRLAFQEVLRDKLS